MDSLLYEIRFPIEAEAQSKGDFISKKSMRAFRCFCFIDTAEKFLTGSYAASSALSTFPPSPVRYFSRQRLLHKAHQLIEPYGQRGLLENRIHQTCELFIRVKIVKNFPPLDLGQPHTGNDLTAFGFAFCAIVENANNDVAVVVGNCFLSRRKHSLRPELSESALCFCQILSLAVESSLLTKLETSSCAKLLFIIDWHVTNAATEKQNHFLNFPICFLVILQKFFPGARARC